MKSILFVTSNLGKLEEAQKLLFPLGFQVEQLNIPYPEIQGSTLEEVALFGINWILSENEVEGALMLEDAGLFIYALSNFPGVYSKFVFTTIGFDGILKLLKEKDNRSAHFEAVIAFCEENGEPVIFKGRVEGIIADEPRGEHGFGYDPIFIPQGEQRTFAEMKTKEKNQHSHRAQALSKLAVYLSKR